MISTRIPREQSNSRRKPRAGALTAAASVMIAVVFSSTSCAATPPAGPQVSSVGPDSTPTPSLDPAVAASESLMESTLKGILARNPKPDQEALRAALVAAGIPAANVEVSVSRTPTGLDVDAMEAAALTGASCVMGQIRDGGVAVSVLPVLTTGKCFVGDSR
ncbi:hypothetical protein [Arthrobacter sp. efr-133-TYG-104]|uniref:DUF6993 domain-containing protein n=1 Tax=Arthrobacter sp. efr-133-TYG-104 TaxID=3040324 RepID=UPI00254F3D51|nr:hypothetical protein [Arthrobacter sp. efr-133-TYG-104]